MTEEPVTVDALPTDGLPPETGEVEETSDAAATQSIGRRNKMLIILGVAVLGGTILGVASTLLISSLKPNPTLPSSAPAPRQDRQQDALIQELKAKNQALETQARQALQVPAPETQTKQPQHAAPYDDSAQLKELKAKNEKLEEQLKLSQKGVPTARYEAPPVLRGKASGEKIAEDCTITDKTEKLGEKLKSCVDGFNSSTR